MMKVQQKMVTRAGKAVKIPGGGYNNMDQMDKFFYFESIV